MKLLYVLIITLCVCESENLVIKNNSEVNSAKEEVVAEVLKNEVTNSKYTSWNYLLSNMLVDKVISEITKQNEETHQEQNLETKEYILTDYISHVLYFYKKFIFDNIFPSQKYNSTASSDPHKSDESRGDPKKEVELVEPRYSGRIEEECVGCTENARTEDCEEGFVKNQDGECVGKVSKFILAVPNHCPKGYVKDWFGFCRISF